MIEPRGIGYRDAEPVPPVPVDLAVVVGAVDREHRREVRDGGVGRVVAEQDRDQPGVVVVEVQPVGAPAEAEQAVERGVLGAEPVEHHQLEREVPDLPPLRPRPIARAEVDAVVAEVGRFEDEVQRHIIRDGPRSPHLEREPPIEPHHAGVHPLGLAGPPRQSAVRAAVERHHDRRGHGQGSRQRADDVGQPADLGEGGALGGDVEDGHGRAGCEMRKMHRLERL